MNQEEAFVQAVLETPDDDAPRLIYADWLDDHGDPRGTFIRLQCEIARLPEEDPRREALAAQAKPLEEQLRAALRQKVRPGWARKIPAWLLREPCTFERGFIAGTTTAVGKFVKGAEALYSAVPLQHLRIRSLRFPSLEGLLKLPLLERLRTLDLSGNRVGNNGAAILAAAPGLRGLTALNLRDTKLRGEAGVSLGGSPHLANLTRLNLRGNSLYDKGVEGLARSEHLGGLTDLDLGWYNNVGPRGAAALAVSVHMARLVSLRLDFNRISERGAVSLADGGLPQLRSLDVSHNAIGDTAAAALLGSTALPGLHALDLARNGLTTAIWRVAPAAALRGRLHLNLSQNSFDVGGTMLDSALLASCVRLELRSCNLRDPEAAALAQSAGIAGLRSLGLGGNHITAVGLAALARSPHLGSLRTLSLPGCPLGPNGTEALLDSPLARQLTHLDLCYCQLAAIDAGRLAAAQGLEGLVELRLRGNPRLDAARARLAERFGSRLVLV
jgi:uncharacterized protein (TIGR02996 family)